MRTANITSVQEGAATYEDEHHARIADWDFESGSPTSLGGDIGNSRDSCASPKDSAYAGESSRRTSWRRESATLPALFAAVEEDYQASVGGSRDIYGEEEIDAPPLPAKST